MVQLLGMENLAQSILRVMEINILDPLPHDRDYFESHLSFVRNYYQKVSSGKCLMFCSQYFRYFLRFKNNEKIIPQPLAQMILLRWDICARSLDENRIRLSGLNFSNISVRNFSCWCWEDISLLAALVMKENLPSVYLGENSLKNIFVSHSMDSRFRTDL